MCNFSEPSISSSRKGSSALEDYVAQSVQAVNGNTVLSHMGMRTDDFHIKMEDIVSSVINNNIKTSLTPPTSISLTSCANGIELPNVNCNNNNNTAKNIFGFDFHNNNINTSSNNNNAVDLKAVVSAKSNLTSSIGNVFTNSKLFFEQFIFFRVYIVNKKIIFI